MIQERGLEPDKIIGSKKFYALKSIRTFFAISDKTLKKYIKKAGASTIRIGHVTYLSGDDLMKIIQPKQNKGFWRR